MTRPPPAAPSTSMRSSSACIASIFDFSSVACFIRPRKSGIEVAFVSGGMSSGMSSALPRDAAAGGRTSTISAPGNASAPPAPADRCARRLSVRPCGSSACARRRRHAGFGGDHHHPAPRRSSRRASLTVRRPASCAALGSSAISSLPSSKRTSRTSRSSALFMPRSRFSRGERDQIVESSRCARAAAADVALSSCGAARGAARPRRAGRASAARRLASGICARADALRRGVAPARGGARAPRRCRGVGRRAQRITSSGVGRSAA